MVEGPSDASWEGDLAKADARVLVAPDVYTTLSITCRTRARHGQTQERTADLGQEGLESVTAYGLAVARGLADEGTPPRRVAVHAERLLGEAGGHLRLASIVLNVRVDSPGLDWPRFEAVARRRDHLQLTLVGALADATVDVQPSLFAAPQEQHLREAQPGRPAGGRRLGRLVRILLLLLVLAAGATVLLYREGYAPPIGRPSSIGELGVGTAVPAESPPPAEPPAQA